LKPDISVFFPAYNEEKNIERTVKEAQKVLSNIANEFEIIIVNDGSIDNTLKIAEALSREIPQVSVINHPHNLGYGAALRSGLKGARYPLIFFTDSDGQFNIEEITKLLPLIESADVVVGYRIKRKDPLIRLFNAWAYGTMIKLLFKLKVKDIDCAFKLFKKSCIDSIEIESNGALASAEILIKLQKLGYKIKEIGVNHYPRAAGEQTGAKLYVILKMFKELWKLYRKLKKGTSSY